MISSIRALQTSDIRARKFSGRHQITSDGRHLIDGIAFGRPYLKRPSRPDVKIPPRKRQKLDLCDYAIASAAEQTNNSSSRLRLQDSYRDEVHPDREADESATSSSNDESDLGMELKLLREDILSENPEAARYGLRGDGDAIITRSRARANGLGLSLPYYGPYYNPLLEQYFDDAPSATFAAEAIRNVNDCSKSPSPADKLGFRIRLNRSHRDASRDAHKMVRFEDTDPETPLTNRPSELSEEDDDDDSDFEPLEDLNDSDKENTQPNDSSPKLLQNFSPESSPFFELAHSERGRAQQTSSSSSPSDVSSKTSFPNLFSGIKSSSDGVDTGAVAKAAENQLCARSPNDLSLDDLVNGTNQRRPEAQAQVNAPPGLGQKTTQRRNQRKKFSKRLKKLKRMGILGPDATLADMESHDQQAVSASNRPEEETENQSESTSELAEKISRDGISAVMANVRVKVATLEARRQALLDSITAGGVDVTTGSMDRIHEDRVLQPRNVNSKQDTKEDASKEVEVSASADSAVGGIGEKSSGSANYEIPDSFGEPVDTGQKDQTTLEATMGDLNTAIGPLADNSVGEQPRRTKLDLASSKRMLFSSLGLKTPKNKAEEIALRDKLKSEVRPPRTLRSAPDFQQRPVFGEANEEEDDSAWRNKIDLRAVECCSEGIELSTPPFPFFQRWDPQQQKGYKAPGSKKSKKAKKGKRGDEQQSLSGSYGSSSQIRRLRPSGSEVSVGECQGSQKDMEQSFAPTSEDNRPGDSLDGDVTANRQPMAGQSADFIRTLGKDISELPPIPEDIENRPPLTEDECRKGAVIVFKRLLMSAETGWQPCISDYLTAVIEEFDASGALSMILAQRDRTHTVTNQDSQASKRLYSKFEMPGYEDEDTSTEDGKLTIMFKEAICPRLLERPALENTVTGNQDTAETSHNNKETGDVSPKIQDQSTNHEATSESQTQHDGIQGSGGDILDLIKDAGWNSSVGSEAAKPLSFTYDNHKTEVSLEEDARDISQVSSSNDRVSEVPIRADHTSNTNSPVPASERVSGVSDSSGSDGKVAYPSLDGLNDETDGFWEDGQRLSPVEETEPFLSQDPVSPPSLRRRICNGDDLQSSLSPFKEEAAVVRCTQPASDSEDEFPELFSHAFEARMTRESTYKEESSQSSSVSRFPKANGKPSRTMRLSTVRTRNSLNRRLQDSPESNETSEVEASAFRSPVSTSLPASQAVDLTIPSDQSGEHETFNDENESTYHPDSSPGWVEKPKADRDIRLVRNTRSRKKTRSR